MEMLSFSAQYHTQAFWRVCNQPLDSLGVHAMSCCQLRTVRCGPQRLDPILLVMINSSLSTGGRAEKRAELVTVLADGSD
eukprot:5811949-Amphidinium_carterae.2